MPKTSFPLLPSVEFLQKERKDCILGWGSLKVIKNQK
jgi:hypothetical protein